MVQKILALFFYDFFLKQEPTNTYRFMSNKCPEDCIDSDRFGWLTAEYLMKARSGSALKCQHLQFSSYNKTNYLH